MSGSERCRWKVTMVTLTSSSFNISFDSAPPYTSSTVLDQNVSILSTQAWNKNVAFSNCCDKKQQMSLKLLHFLRGRTSLSILRPRTHRAFVHLLVSAQFSWAQCGPVHLNPRRLTPNLGAHTMNSLKGKKQEKTISQEEDNGRSPPFGSPFHPWSSTRDAIVWRQCDMGQSFRRGIAFN